MIKAYLTWISTPYEGEDIEIRYSIFKDGELTHKESYLVDYCKPALCGLLSMEKLLKVLEDYIKDEIIIVINDGALYEMLNGTSRTKKQEVQQMGSKIRKAADKFYNLDIENVSGNHVEMLKWDEILKP